MDHTRAAVARVTADVSSRQLQLFAQKFDEERARLDIHRNLFLVHLHRDPFHGSSDLFCEGGSRSVGG